MADKMTNSPTMKPTPNVTDPSPIVIVANRLPISWTPNEGWSASPGGLASSIGAAMVNRSSTWIGWSGSSSSPAVPARWEEVALEGITLTDQDVALFYDGMSNRCLWPCFHDGIQPAQLEHPWWERYVEVNHRYAARVAAVAPRGALVWVHDYQLMLVPAMVRALRPDLRIGFFLHIPFPPPAIFARLPWRTELLDGLLGADVVGFQTPGDADHFRDACTRTAGATPAGATLRFGQRVITVGAYPVSIDAAAYDLVARDPAVIARAAQIREGIGADRTLLVGIDRLDYTKAIGRRLEAFRTMLTADPSLAERVAMIQVAVPTRERVAEYQAERHVVEHLVGELNGRFGTVGSPMVHYLHSSMDTAELVALYRAADVMVVTPWRDGMNLVAKEFVASRPDERGVLVLSEFAGAAVELQDALLVNPFDEVGMAAVLAQAVRMNPSSQQLRMQRLRRRVNAWDVDRWAASFLSDLGRRRSDAAVVAA
jgi:trehalose 6-phosphate synthase